MLSQIRERATGWIAWAIVILISIPFALWGINSYFEGLTQVNVATVDGEEIDYQIYQNALSERRRVLLQSLGSNVDPDLFSSEEFKRQVLDGLIDDVLLTEQASRYGYRISDAQLASWIQSLPQFQRDGAFNAELYADTLSRVGYTVAQFEQAQRRQSTFEQMRNGLTDSAFVTDADVDSMLALLYQERQADYVLFTPEMFTGDVEVADADIETEYETNKSRYRTPERLRVEYLELSVDGLAEGIEPNEEELRQLYEENIGRYRAPEQRRASHILITVAEGADDEAVQSALQRAEELSALAREGADFAELARENSQDTGSAQQGGDLGVINRGVMVEPFENAVFSMSEGEISEPVRSPYGYHVIKLSELVPERVRDFDEVRDQVRDQERRRQAESQFIDLSESFRNLVYERPDSLQPASDELGLEIKQSDWFTRSSGDGIAADARLREIAFGEEVLEQELNSEVVERGANALVAMRRLEHASAQPRPLDEVRDEIRERLERTQAASLAVKKGEELVAALLAGGEWATLVAQTGREVEVLPARRRDAVGEARDVAALVFSAPAPQGGAPAFGGGAIAGERYAVFRLSGVTLGNPEQVDDPERERVAGALQRRRGFEYFLSFQTGLRQRADIKVYAEQL